MYLRDLLLFPGTRQTTTHMPLPQAFCRIAFCRILRLAFVPVAFFVAVDPALAQVTASPSSVNFGDVQIGTKSTLPVVLTNNGGSAVSITTGQIQGHGFMVTGVKLPIVLNPGQNFTINATFAPQADGAYSGTVTGSGSSGPLVSVPVSGNGTQAGYSVNLTWDPPSSQVVGYNVYRGNQSGGPYGKLNSHVDPNTAFIDYTVLASQTYYYVTTSVDSSGHESAYSNQSEANIP